MEYGSLRIFHGGRFVAQPNVKYDGGVCDIVDNFPIDKLSDIEAVSNDQASQAVKDEDTQTSQAVKDGDTHACQTVKDVTCGASQGIPDVHIGDRQGDAGFNLGKHEAPALDTNLGSHWMDFMVEGGSTSSKRRSGKGKRKQMGLEVGQQNKLTRVLSCMLNYKIGFLVIQYIDNQKMACPCIIS